MQTDFRMCQCNLANPTMENKGRKWKYFWTTLIVNEGSPFQDCRNYLLQLGGGEREEKQLNVMNH